MKTIVTTAILLALTSITQAGTVIAYQDGRNIFINTVCKLNGLDSSDITGETYYYVSCNSQDWLEDLFQTSVESYTHIEVANGNEFILNCPVDVFTYNVSDFTLVLNCNIFEEEIVYENNFER